MSLVQRASRFFLPLSSFGYGETDLEIDPSSLISPRDPSGNTLKLYTANRAGVRDESSWHNLIIRSFSHLNYYRRGK